MLTWKYSNFVRMQKEEVINNLKRLAQELSDKKYITLKDVRSVPRLGHYVYFHFKTLNKALSAAGLPSSHLASSMNIDDLDLLNYLIDLQNELGHPPTLWDIQHDENIYKKYSQQKISWSIYKSRFDGLRKAKQLVETGNPKSASVRKVSKFMAKKENGEEDSEFLQAKRRYWGKAAELHVTAELLYHGFQAANIPVDVGLDVLAVKKNKTFYFQVKHKDLSNNQAIKITKSSFQRTGGGEVYYIFVLLLEEKRDFMIIPYHLMSDWIKEKIVEDTDDGYLVYIKYVKGESRQYTLKEKVLDNYLNNWENIK